MLVLASASGVEIFLNQIESGIVIGAIYALVALGYTLVYGIIELINFAHGDVFMWSTVVILTIVQAMGITQPLVGISLIGVLLLLIVAGSAVSAAINVTIERVAYRRLRKAPRLAPLIAAIGISFTLENIAQLWKGGGGISFPPLFPKGGVLIGAVSIEYLDIFIILLAIAVMYGLERFINATKMGRAMRATAQDPEAAALMGVNINQTIAMTFLIGGALAGVAGVAYTLYIGNVWFFTGFQLGLVAFTAAVLGGIGNVNGAVLGGFLLGLIQTMTVYYMPNGIAWSDAIAFSILVLILVFRPSGLLGQQIPDKV
jgi:branched-chain amino acid transport system permease protein